MSLSPFDDLPVHQIAEPIRHVATSDRNFYDRFYFNCHTPDGDLFLVMGMGVYPNLGVTDAFAVINDRRSHTVVRASRELGDRADLSVGPFRIEVLEGLRRLRFVLEANEWGLDFDLTWDGFDPAHLEPRHLDRSFGRVVIDTSRFAQTGSWSGVLHSAGRTYEVAPDRWQGSRDRSWGVRPIGEPEPPGIHGTQMLPGFFWIYAPFRAGDRAMYFVTQERPDGERILEEASFVRSFASGGGEPAPIGRPEHELTFIEGTREIERAVLRFGDFEVRVTPLLRMHVGIGTGYGFDADWRHGMYQGALVVQGKTWDLTTQAGQDAMYGLVDSVARFDLPDGTTGFGLFEYLVLGPYPRYGFESW
ncbi:MAG: hypothetical protein ABR548_07565 [Actinomycetota bacterium]|nr:hypothetical protein [Actinomycetota bacterium]